LFLYDLKFIDNEKHHKYTGASNELILENLRTLTQQHPNVVVRIPFIPGINDTAADIKAFETYLLSLESIQGVCILPYHKAGVAKAKRLLRKTSSKFETALPTNAQMDRLVRSLEKHGFDVQIGG
jgi:pyruvate formate lyase activating enzyme